MSDTPRRVRTCIGCRRVAAPVGWWRIAAAQDGTVAIGPAPPGRGAWVCSPGCFETAVQRGALARALRTQVSSADVSRLRATLIS